MQRTCKLQDVGSGLGDLELRAVGVEEFRP